MVIVMKSVAVLLALLPATPMAQKLTEIETHTHGVGRVAISFESNEFTVILAVPGADIVGFEHAAENKEERTEVAAAMSDLSKPLELFEVSPDAECETATANVGLVGDAFGQVDDQTGNRTEVHTEFQANYMMRCQEIQLVTSIRFTYFDVFSGAQKLEVNLISAADERSYTVYRDAPVFTLGD